LSFAINAILNLSNRENADVSDVMISKRKFDISLDVTLVSTNLSSQTTEREININVRLPFLTSGTSTFSSIIRDFKIQRRDGDKNVA